MFRMRLCQCCNTRFTNGRRASRICPQCIRDDRKPAKHFSSLPVKKFVVSVFGDDEGDRFGTWALTIPGTSFVLTDRDEGYDTTNMFDRLLSAYDRFPTLCNPSLRTALPYDVRLHPHAIHIAAESGLKWDEGVRHMVEVDSEILTVTHPQTGLYPFEIAASAGCLDLSFRFLRMAPHLVADIVAMEGIKQDYSDMRALTHLGGPELDLIYKESEDGVYVYSSDEDEHGTDEVVDDHDEAMLVDEESPATEN